MDSKIEIVKAHRIDNEFIYYECSYCWTNYKANGEPTKRAKRGIHKHGSRNCFENRTELRVPHCSKARNFIEGISIIIDDTTLRCI